jgi:hypothetical protein
MKKCSVISPPYDEDGLLTQAPTKGKSGKLPTRLN